MRNMQWIMGCLGARRTLISIRPVLIAQLIACAAPAAAGVGCGTSGTALRAPVQAVGVDVAADRSMARCTLEDTTGLHCT
jgi:hypothetical protein